MPETQAKKLAVISLLIEGKEKVSVADLKWNYPNQLQTYWGRKETARELTKMIKEATQKGYYENKSLDQLKEEYLETVTLALSQFDFTYFKARILLNKPMSLTRPTVYIGINYHSFTFCHRESKSPKDKQILWFKKYDQVRNIKIQPYGFDVMVSQEEADELISISIETDYAEDILNLMQDYKDVLKRKKTSNRFISKYLDSLVKRRGGESDDDVADRVYSAHRVS